MKFLQNYRTNPTLLDNDGQEIRMHKPVEEMVADLAGATGGWPKSLNATDLFVPDDLDGVRFLENEHDFVAWVKSKVGLRIERRQVVAGTGADARIVAPVTMRDLFYHLKTSAAERYKGVSHLPHEPMIDDLFYVAAAPELPAGDYGQVIEEYLDLFNPQGDVDRKLLRLALLTLFCGVYPGGRPGFLITSRHGRGAGKTATAWALAAVAGGAVEIGAEEQTNRMLEAFWSESSANTRVVAIDNLKRNLDSAAVEAMITSAQIEGHKLYAGRRTRPNLFTWLITANTPQISNDLAERCLTIQLGPARGGVDFYGAVRSFLQERGDALVKDILGLLRHGERRSAVRPPLRGRFPAWEQSVLLLESEAELVMEAAKERRSHVDSDYFLADQIADRIRSEIERHNIDPDTTAVVLSWDTLVPLVREATGDRAMTKQAVSRMIGGCEGVGRMANLRKVSTSRSLGGKSVNVRGVRWVGDRTWEVEDAGLEVEIHYL